MHERILNWVRPWLSESWKVAHIVRHTQHLRVRIVERLLRRISLLKRISQPLYIWFNSVRFLNKILYFFCNKVSYFANRYTALIMRLFYLFFFFLLLMLLQLQWLIFLWFGAEEKWLPGMQLLAFGLDLLYGSEIIALSILLWLCVQIFKRLFYIEVVLILCNAAHYIGSLGSGLRIIIVVLEWQVWIYCREVFLRTVGLFTESRSEWGVFERTG